MIAVKACACGKLYTLEGWLTLPFAGRDPAVPAVMHDRRCIVSGAHGPCCIHSDDWICRPGCTWSEELFETTFELRNCPCGSTMALEIERGGLAPYSDSEIAEREARDTIVDELEAGAV